ncbi:MAG: HAMP domain-containing histidine kinase [Acidobacteria bacterium]|nr:HAMP domain-containing histidine kinase [Acidobacteriota bacterium]
MKISTRIATGFAVLILLILSVLAYQVAVLHQLQRLTHDLAQVQFKAASASLQLIRELEEVEEYTWKLLVTRGDAGYQEKLEELQHSFTRHLEELGSTLQNPREKKAFTVLRSSWRDFLRDGNAATLASAAPAAEDAFRSDLEKSFARLHRLTDSVLESTKQSIVREVQTSQQAVQTATRVFWLSAAGALALALLVSYFSLQPLSNRLKKLTEGTRAIARGQFSYRLSENGKDEFTQMSRAFNNMAMRLNELDQLKKDFVSHVSHELKAPLASIHETLSLLLEEIPGPLGEKQRRLLQLSLQSSKRLSSMISNLLDLSRMEAGVMRYEIKPQDLVSLVRTAVAEFDAPAREKGNKLELNAPAESVVVPCDPDRILQVVENLLSNALNFSPSGSSIRVQVESVAELPSDLPERFLKSLSNGFRSPFAMVSVADAGPGIPNQQKELIFEKFHQVKQGKKVFGQGVGLGLAISRTIVEAHGGAIWVQDRPDSSGSVFSVLLRTDQRLPEVHSAPV